MDSLPVFRSLHFVKSSYSVDAPPPRIRSVLDFLEDRGRLCFHILKHFSTRFSNDERLNLLEEKIRNTACEAEYSLEEYKQDEHLLMKILFSKADDIDLLSTKLLRSFMPKYFNHGVSYVVSSSDFKEYEVHREFCYAYNANSSSPIPVEKKEIVDLLIADSKSLSELGLVSICSETNLIDLLSLYENDMKIRSVARRIYSDHRMNKWFPIRAWVTVFTGDRAEDLLKDILQTVLETNQWFPETSYQLSLAKMSVEELRECLHKHFEDQRYFIVIHNFVTRLTSRVWDVISCSFPDNKNGSRIMFTTNIEIAFGIASATNLVVQYQNDGIISALLKEETNVFADKNNQAERFQYLQASSEEVAEASDNDKVGLDECFYQLLPELVRSLSPQLEKVAIVGMAGIGKTTLAKRIFEDPSITSRFHIRAWIDISQFYQKRSLLIQLLQGITQTDDESHNETDAQLEEKVNKCLKGRRYLIVLDNMWSIEAWNELKRTFPDDKNASRILLTSRAVNIMEGLNCRTIHHKSLLTADNSWELLKRKVLGQHNCPPGLSDIGKQIAERCRGLPLAIVVVAGILSKRNKTTDSWAVVATSVSSHVMGSESATQAIFSLSYEHLPAYLKPCFLYMAAFPGGYEIEVRILIRLWIAEGFIDDAQTKCLEDVAEEYLNDLIDRSLLVSGRRRSIGRLKTCRLHDLVLEFCVQEARKHRFLDVIEEFRLLDSNTTIDGHRRYSFHCHTFDDVHLTSSKSSVGSALFFGVSFHLVPDILLHYFDFKLLRILDLISWRFDNFPTEQIEKLLLLRYLALTASFELPATLFKLQKLQTLIINGPWLSNDKIPELPLEFWRSTSLTHLQLRVANHIPSPEKSSTEAKYLNFLQTLTNITLGSCTHQSFSSIPNISNLGVCETREDFPVVGLWDSFFQNVVLLKCIQNLKISCFGHNRPLPLRSSDAFPKSLTKLTLRQSNLPWKAMALIGDLPNLEVLKLRNYAFEGPNWVTGEGGFQCLKYLLIEETDLMYWELEDHDRFPRLEQLVLKFCQVLEKIPAEIADIPTLTHIRLENCCGSVESSAKDIQEECNEYSQDINIQIRSHM